MADTQKLNFQSAMDDFKTMFPHLENSLIEQILRSNNGMVDQTIDDLLAISCDDPEVSSSIVTALTSNQPPAYADINTRPLLRPIEQQPPTRSGVSTTGPPLSYPTLSSYLPPGDLTLTPRSQQSAYKKYGQVPVSVMGVQFKIPYTEPLPGLFLKPAEFVVPPHSSSLAAQMAEDREFALLLHNEDFLQQAQINEEFMRALNQEDPPKSIESPGPSHRAHDETTISQRLASTGKATRSKLLKIAKKLNWRKAPVLSKAGINSKYRQPLLNEDDEEEEELLLTGGGDSGLMITDFEEYEEEEFKTIPRQHTIENFQAAQARARETVAMQFRGERPPPPPVPPPPASDSSSSNISRSSDYFSAGGTLENTGSLENANKNRPAARLPTNLLDLSADDAIYDNDSVRTPSRLTMDHDDVSTASCDMNVSMSDTSSMYADSAARAIHSDTLSSSYFIPIRTVAEHGSVLDMDPIYDNLNCDCETESNRNLIDFKL